MNAIGPGDWVECIDASGEGPLAIGRIYQVSDVYPSHPGRRCYCHQEEVGGLNLVELPAEIRGANVLAHCILCFRPIYRPKQSIIEDLKQPAPDRELEDA